MVKQCNYCKQEKDISEFYKCKIRELNIFQSSINQNLWGISSRAKSFVFKYKEK